MIIPHYSGKNSGGLTFSGHIIVLLECEVVCYRQVHPEQRVVNTNGHDAIEGANLQDEVVVG